MSAALAERRRARAAGLLVLAVIAAVLAWLGLGWREAQMRPPPPGGLAAPDFAARAKDAQLIVITTKEGVYRIQQTQRGWAMRDRGDYPVRKEALAAFTDGLSKLSFGRAMTKDPAKHARLGLDDPTKGGEGVLVQVQDAQGGLLANLVVNVTPNGAFVRRATEPQAYQAVGKLPPLRAAGQWLDLAPFTIAAERIARVDLAPPTGPGFAIVRSSLEGGDFRIAPPFANAPVLSPAGISGAASALGRLQPVDVAAAPSVSGAPSARAVLRTLDGLVIEADLFAVGARRWVKLGARADSPELPAAAEAVEINRRAGPWAYAITQADYENIAPLLETLVSGPRPPAPRPVAAPAQPPAPQ
jgi:hypothetical protein